MRLLCALVVLTTLGYLPACAESAPPAAASPASPPDLAKTDPAKTDPAKPDPAKTDPAKPDLAKPDLAFAAFQRGRYVTALKEAMLRLDANKTDAPAMTLIGELYSQGLGVRLDAGEAARWYRLAANLDNREAQFALAMLNLQGRGVPKDRPTARALLEKAAAQGHPGAYYNLGVLALEGEAGERPHDFAAAAANFQRAADLGDPDASYSLAILYREGKGVAASPVRAADLLGVAAREKNPAAQVELAIMLFNGDEPGKPGSGIPKDEAAAAKLFLAAAARGNAIAQNRAARLLAAGRGIKEDKLEASKWHILARAAGLADAYLDGVLNALTPEDKAKVDAAVRRQTGG